MAITPKPQTPPSGDELDLNFNNGDLEALKNTVSRLKFKDEASMLRFMLAVISQSATTSITITKQDGTKTSLNPSPELLKPLENS